MTKRDLDIYTATAISVPIFMDAAFGGFVGVVTLIAMAIGWLVLAMHVDGK